MKHKLAEEYLYVKSKLPLMRGAIAICLLAGCVMAWGKWYAVAAFCVFTARLIYGELCWAKEFMELAVAELARLGEIESLGGKK